MAYQSLFETSTEDADPQSLINRYRQIRKRLYEPPQRIHKPAPSQLVVETPPKLPAPVPPPEEPSRRAPQGGVWDVWKERCSHTMQQLHYILGRQPKHVIVALVCDKFGIDEATLRSKKRKANLSQPRFEAYYRLHYELGMGLAPIGRFLNRDHSSIINGLKTYARWQRCMAGLEEWQGGYDKYVIREKMVMRRQNDGGD